MSSDMMGHPHSCRRLVNFWQGWLGGPAVNTRGGKELSTRPPASGCHSRSELGRHMAQALGFLSAHQLRRNRWGEGMGNFASHLWWA